MYDFVVFFLEFQQKRTIWQRSVFCGQATQTPHHRGKGKRIKLNKCEIENLHKHIQEKTEEDQNEKEEMM